MLYLGALLRNKDSISSIYINLRKFNTHIIMIMPEAFALIPRLSFLLEWKPGWWPVTRLLYWVAYVTIFSTVQ